MGNLRDVLKHRLIRAAGLEIKSEYVTRTPSPQNALDIFRHEWASRFPEPYGNTGANPLFDDDRIAWLNDTLGGMGNMRILECGPLEGAHTHMMERFGAASVTAIEANTRAYLRCLITKEILGLSRSRFLLGDFVAFLEDTGRFDLIVACGVLYHLRDPVIAIARAAEKTDRLYIWTHYYEPAIIRANPALALRFSDRLEQDYGGFRHTLHRQNYQTKLGNPRFFGGAEAFSHWLERPALLGALRYFGFDEIEIQFDRQDPAAGPNISLLARRGG